MCRSSAIDNLLYYIEKNPIRQIKKLYNAFPLMLTHVEEQELHGRIKVDIGF